MGCLGSCLAGDRWVLFASKVFSLRSVWIDSSTRLRGGICGNVRAGVPAGGHSRRILRGCVCRKHVY